MPRFSRFSILALLGSSALTSVANAQDAATVAQEDSEVIIVTGTRAVGQRADQAAAPIQLLDDEALEHVGQPNLNQALTQLVPSFQAQSQGTDMASFSLSARLRGVSPNHTLVMVNGKRRHGNSILQVINGAFGGSAAPSIDLIPPDIVERIEILQEGAAAQYGSDAIAGVINIILKSDTSGGEVKASAGEYYDGEGTQYSVSGNFGMEVGDSGYLDVSLFHRRNDYTTIGDGQFSVRNYNGSTVTNVTPAFFPIYDALAKNDGTAGINGGQPRSLLNVGFYNFGYDFGPFEFYSFGDTSYRHGDALQGYRVPNRLCRNPATALQQTSDPTNCFLDTATYGMVPHIEVKQNEFQITNGVRGDIGDWFLDLAASYSEDESKVYTTHSANASLFIATGQSPRFFYDGSFKFTQFTGTLDVRREIDVSFLDSFTLAFGGEYRKESYTIGQGDGPSLYVEGGQSFPGYAASDAGTIDRNAKAFYANVIANPTPDITLDLAGRVEDYSDFGTTTIGKLTGRWDITDGIAIRGTISTGFRAPSLPESGYSATNVGPTSAVVQLAPSSPGAASAGFGALGPEESFNVSGGLVFRPIPRLVVTLDGYFIRIKDRIVSSGSITGQNAVPIPLGATLSDPSGGIQVLTPLINGLTPYQLVQNAIIASGKQLDPTVLKWGTLSIQTFTNGIDTETKGVELSARYPVDFDFGTLDLTLGANYNDNKVTENRLGTLFNLQAQAIIEQASPKFKSVFGALFESGPFKANARATYYSKTVALVQPNSASTTPRPIGSPTNGYYEGIVDPAVIVDFEVSYDYGNFLNLAIGANNIFDKLPEVPELVADYNPATWPPNGRSPYINNGGALNAPYNHGPYGTNGGYFYTRLTLKF